MHSKYTPHSVCGCPKSEACKLGDNCIVFYAWPSLNVDFTITNWVYIETIKSSFKKSKFKEYVNFEKSSQK